MNQKQRGWKLCWRRGVAKIRLQQKQIRKVLNMKHQMSNVQDFSCLKMHKSRYEFVSFCYMIEVSEITDETGKGEEEWYKRKTH